MSEFLALCRAAIGETYVLTDAQTCLPYESDMRQRAKGKALAIFKPATTEQVAQLVRLCAHFAVGIVPQGGNTGLVLGSTPDETGTTVVLSLKRLNSIRHIDASNNTMIVEAGCLLSEVQDAAQQSDRLFPLSLASEGSCTIGGNLSSNAGGTAVLRYGNARELCLGLEVVTASGEIWHGLRSLRKDNTGYDLRDLFIGAEGTLGIITAAVLKLFPQPKAKITAIAGIASPQAALHLFSEVQQECGTLLTGFELMSEMCMQLVYKHFPQLSGICPFTCPHYILIELRLHQTPEAMREQFENMLSVAMQQGLIQNAVLANSETQALELWKLREFISSAQAREGKNIKHDISLPVSQIASFIETTDALLQTAYPASRMVCFGHLGDGNLHYNVSAPEHVIADVFLQEQEKINRIVHDSVHRFNGSISAEHGIGVLKKPEILLYKSKLELDLMRAIKKALDPDNLMNPGKIL